MRASGKRLIVHRCGPGCGKPPAEGERVTDAQQLWDGCAGAIQSQVSEATWRTWFASVRPIDATDDTLVLGVPNALVRERLESRFAGMLTDAIFEAVGSAVTV